jgi:DNA-binding IclR family transcriptional regulator
MSQTRSKGVSTTERSFALLDFLQEQDGATMRRMTEEFDLSKSTVHKHLTTLLQEGYVTKRGEHYHLGLAFYNKGEYVRRQREYFSVGKEIVEELHEDLKEDVEFIAETTGRAMIIHESYHDRGRYSGALQFQHEGMYFHLHSTAAGKAILAKMSNGRIRRIADEWGLPAYTDKTITDIDELIEEIEQTRERGYALSDEEYAEGLRAVSHCVEQPDGSALGAISVCVPIFRANETEFTERLPTRLEDYAETFEERIRDMESYERVSYSDPTD